MKALAAKWRLMNEAWRKTLWKYCDRSMRPTRVVLVVRDSYFGFDVDLPGRLAERWLHLQALAGARRALAR